MHAIQRFINFANGVLFYRSSLTRLFSAYLFTAPKKGMCRNTMADKDREVRRQVVTDIKAKNSVWKKRLCDTFQELHIVPERFTGKLVISFKDGGISFVEKTETFK
jgi:hypothetical protein